MLNRLATKYIAHDPRWILMKELPKVSCPLTVMLIGVMVLSVLLSSVFVFASGQLVGAVSELIREGDGPQTRRPVYLFLSITIFAFFTGQCIGPIQQALSRTLGRRLESSLQSRVMRATALPLGAELVERSSYQDLVLRTRNAGLGQYGPDQAVLGLVDFVSRRLQALAATTLIAIYYNPLVAIILFVALISIRSGLRDLFIQSLDVLQKSAGTLRRSEYYLDLAIGSAAAKDVRVFGLHKLVIDGYRSQWLQVIDDLWNKRRAGFIESLPKTTLLVFSVMTLPLMLVTHSAVEGRITLAALAIVSQAIVAMFDTLFRFRDSETWLEYGSASVPATYQLEAAAGELQLNGNVQPTTALRSDIEFRNVSFVYPESTRHIFRDLNLLIPGGKSTAIVGANGAGKSTLIKLLCRLYDPTDGVITVDNQNLKDLDPVKWRETIAVIFQDFVRYELSARDNVGLGALSLMNDQKALEHAAHQTGVHDLVAKLPEQWETILSAHYQGGVDLSGGQWQRISLARTLLRLQKNARLLILDEPTASMDVRSESALFESLLDQTKGVTSILISHRFSTVKHADKIVVINEGQIVESGSHAELIDIGGLYAKMYQLQASHFQ